jgi:alanyl-tRNA synthetase
MGEPVSENWKTEAVGREFLAYFRSHGYRELPGSSLLTRALPMTFVMSAGMVQFEELAGSAKPGDRYTLIQNCFRHFDLENVGISPIHLSLFRMPAAFDFGVIDRQAAVESIWRLLIDIYRFDPVHMAVTYFGGGKVDEMLIPEDAETRQAWQAVKPPPGSLTALAYPGNFWKQTARLVGKANSQKCGPTTEIFYDRGEQFACGKNCRPGCACGRYIEMLNTLFITQQVGEAHQPFTQLAIPFTETVIGLERVAALLQGKFSVYETDELHLLTQQARCCSHVPPETSQGVCSFYENLIVDHLRAISFLAADGAPPPGKGGRRRLMRFLMREFLGAKIVLNINDAGFEQAMLQVATELYPELADTRQIVLDYISDEAERFEIAVNNSLERLNAEVSALGGLPPDEKTLRQIATTCGVPFFLANFLLEQKRYYRPNHVVLAASRPLTLPKLAGAGLSMRKCQAHALEGIFIDAFRKLGYQQLPEGSLLDDSIPMSFVMSAGLVQVERGSTRLRKKGQQRFILAQKCFRHFDVARVGSSDIHLSLFRMLGAFTFGEIDRRAEITKAMALITEKFCFPPGRLWATYYEGGEIAGYTLPEDLETRTAWIESGMPEEHVIGLDQKHNFWQQSALLMGPAHARKCGPNTEVFFDRGEQYRCSAGCRPGCNCGRFVEFLNMLFITWDLDEAAGDLRELEQPFTEMVLGVERLAMVLQKMDSIYRIDNLLPLYLRVKQDARPGGMKAEDAEQSVRVIADHIRALTFLVADGAPSPGKQGRSYIIRKLIRAVAHNQRLLNIAAPNFLSELVQVAVDKYEKVHPAVVASQNTLVKYLQAEYQREEEKLKKSRKEGSMNTNKVVQIMRAVHHNLPGSIRADRFYALLFDRVRQEVQFPYAAEGNRELMEEQKNWRTRPLVKENQIPDILLTEKTARLVDQDLNETLAKQGIKLWSPNRKPLAWLGVPLLTGEEVIGALVVENWHAPDAFDEDSKRTLMLIARQAASALENHLLFERLERKVRSLKMLNEAGQQLTSSTYDEEDEILGLIVEQARKIEIDISNLYIALYDPDINESDHYEVDHPEKNRILGTLKFGLAFEEGQLVDTAASTEWQPRRAGSGLTEYVIKTKCSYNSSDVRAAYATLARDYLGRIPASWLGVPMLAKDQVLGVIVLRNYEYANLYSTDDQEFLEILAGQAAVAIQNARLYLDLVREQERVNAGERMLAMSEVANEFAHRMNNLAGTIPVWVNRTRKLLNADEPRDQVILRNLGHIYDDSQIILQAAQRMKKSSDPRAKEPVSINELLETAIRRAFAARPGSEERMIINREYDSGLPTIKIEKDTLQEVFDNLVRNAVEAILPNNGQITITTLSVMEKGKSWLFVMVADTGKGIPPDQLTKIFDLFHTTKSTGLGFGLWRTKTFMKQVGGDIDVHSEPGKGTTFILRIPVGSSEETPLLDGQSHG